jgi:hypothetical protein
MGSFGETSTVITNNARSFDNLSFDIGQEWFKVFSIYGEIDNLSANSIFLRGEIFSRVLKEIKPFIELILRFSTNYVLLISMVLFNQEII